MTLRRRLQLIILIFAVTLVGTAIWERIIYLRARSELSLTLANNMELDEVAKQLSAALSVTLLLSLTLIVLGWIFLDKNKNLSILRTNHGDAKCAF